MDPRVHGWFASHRGREEHSVKKAHRVCQLWNNAEERGSFSPPPRSRKFPRKYLLTSWRAFLPALTIVLMVPQTPNQTAQGWRSSFFMGHSCCCFKSHHSFISSAFRGSFCLQVVFSWVVQNPQLCSAVVLLGVGGAQPCTQAAIPASEIPNIQAYKFSFNFFICPCPTVRVSERPVLEEEMDSNHSFSEIIPIFFTLNWGAMFTQGSTESKHSLWVLTHKVSLFSSRCCKNVLKMLSGDISAHFIFVIPRKQNLSTRRLTDLRNSIVTGLWCSKIQNETQQPGRPLAFMLFFRLILSDKERDCPPGLALRVFLMCFFGNQWQIPMAAQNKKLSLLLIPRVQPRPHKWWVSRLGNLNSSVFF